MNNFRKLIEKFFLAFIRFFPAEFSKNITLKSLKLLYHLRLIKFFSVQLDQFNKLSLMVPPGFAHGFQVLNDDSQIIYTHSKEYSKEFEGGINALDPDINIQWPLPVIGLSDRDKNLPLLEELINTKTI